jgi:alkylresorcinol/alkylpyrone synthase
MPSLPAPLAHVLSVGTALPPHRYEQDELIAAFQLAWAHRHHNTRRVAQLHQAVQVGGRNLALPMQDYLGLDFTQANDAWIRVGTEVGAHAMRNALAGAGLQPRDLDAIFFTTVTGVAAPSIDARLVNRLGLRPDIKRTPMFGLGCVAGAAGLARAADYLKAWPDHAVALLSVELCSLTLQREDLSIPNLVASGLFGDGAAAVILVGPERLARMGIENAPGPAILASRSRFYPDTERVMGWDIGSSGFKIVLAATVPDVVRRHIGLDVDDFLGSVGLTRDHIRSWVCHPGGPKVLEAFEETLGISREDTALTWRSLAAVGNLSSASVLFVLGDTLTERRPAPGSMGTVLALGPGFCSELVLVRW